MSSASDTPLLLHSLATFSSHVLRCLDIAGPRRIVEIGSETGGFTLELASWADGHDALLVSIDPEPAPAVRREAENATHLQLVTDPSPWALEGLEPGDVYIIDGDHNHWTVLAELRAAFGDREPGPLAIMHDVAWPWARRDLYYAPERLPDEGVHEHTFRGGVRPGEEEASMGGFRSLGHFAFARREGGERNGVLTAVDDFRREREGLRFMRIPCVFGVGFLFAEAAPWASALEAELGPFDEDPLLQTLESNRLALYQQVLDLQDEMEMVRGAADRTIADLHRRIGELQAENAALRLAAASPA